MGSSTSNWSSTEESKTHDRGKTPSSTNAPGKTGYPQVEDWN
jgi:hypothetical protein